MQLSEPPGVKVKHLDSGKPFFSSLGGSLIGVEMETKTCPRCEIEKPVEDFSKHKHNKDGLQTWCKCCRKKYYSIHREKIIINNRNYRIANRKKINIQANLYRKKNREKIAANQREYYRSHKEDHSRYYQEQNIKYPEREKARHAISSAIRSGKLIRPDICEICDCICKPVGHHQSYLEENWLNVNWLCISCHQTIHARLREVINE